MKHEHEIENILKSIDKQEYVLEISTVGMEIYYDMLDCVQGFLRKKGFDARYYDDSIGKRLVAIEKHRGKFE